MVGSCPRGQILRKSYSRKSYTRKSGSHVRGSKVKASCIRDVGSIGKGKKVFKNLRVGSLIKHGYSLAGSRDKRRKSLRKAVNEYGTSSTIKKLNVISVYNKRSHPKTSRKAKEDIEYVRTLKN